MRTVLAALALLTLAACDGGGPDDALVGTWTLTGFSSEVRVTSRTAQTVPDRTVAPSGSISVTGATNAMLGTVVNLFADEDGNVNLSVESGDIGAPGYVQLVLQELTSDSQASLLDADAGLSYNAYFTPRRSLVTRDGGRFAVAPVTLSTGNETATVSGTLRYPDLALVPGQPAIVEQFETPLSGTARFVFEADGSFRATAFSPDDDQEAAGTWERVGDDVRITVTEGGETETVTFRATLNGGSLVLASTDLDERTCTAECIRFYEGTAFAAPGSLSAIDFLTTLRFGSRAPASARAADARAAASRPSRTVLPIVGPLLSDGR